MDEEQQFTPRITNKPDILDRDTRVTLSLETNKDLVIILEDKDITREFYEFSEQDIFPISPQLEGSSTPAQSLAHIIEYDLFSARATAVEEAAQFDRAMELEGPEERHVHPLLYEKDLEKETKQETIEYLNWLREREVPVVARTVNVLDQHSGEIISYQRYLIGNLENNDKGYDGDLGIVKTLDFAAQTLNIRIPDNLKIFSLRTFEEKVDELGEQFKSSFTGKLQNRGLGTPGVAVILERATPQIDDASQKDRVVDSELNQMVIEHEVLHAIDPYYERKTSQGLKEGFTVSISLCGLDPDKGMEILQMETLRKEFSKGIATKSRVLHALNSDNASRSDAYYTSGIFFSYIYKLYGAEAFMDFYDMASLGADTINSQMESPEDKSKISDSNILDALNVVGTSQGHTGEDILEKFIDYYNKDQKQIQTQVSIKS